MIFVVTGNERTVLTVSKKHLGLIGPEDSVYLRLIQREAEKAGLPVLRVSQRDERCWCYVIDSEAGDVDIHQPRRDRQEERGDPAGSGAGGTE